jgi:hypothetical protein
VIGVGCLCLVGLAKGNLAEARGLGAGVLAVVFGSPSGMREEAGWLWGAMVVAGAEGGERAGLRLRGATGARAGAADGGSARCAGGKGRWPLR